MTIFPHWLLTILALYLYLPALSAGQISLVSTESDPDAFIENSVNIINGDYCESATDLVISGPDALVLQRFYSTKDAVTGTQAGNWRILPQRFLVVGKHPYNLLYSQNDRYELILGDGTKRVYQRVEALPSQLFGEELTPMMAAQVLEPNYFLLVQEVLPSGNQLFLSYDEANHLVAIEMKNSFGKTLSWIHFAYEFNGNTPLVSMKTSDSRELTYHFVANQLTHVGGSHSIPITYEYDDNVLIKKVLPEECFVEIVYEECHVKTFDYSTDGFNLPAGSHLPTITYNDNFEDRHRYYRSGTGVWKEKYEDSTIYDLKSDNLPDLPNGLGIGFINGVWNDLDDAKESAQYLSKLTGEYNIHGVHNATHSRDVDLRECRLGLNYIATKPVRLLHKMWNSFFENNSADAKFLMICHSQGTIHVRNALLDYSPELRKRILVIAIAPGGYIYKGTCAQVIHYRAEWWRDFIPRLDKAGARREKDTTVILKSHRKAPLFDHEFKSPTYRKKIKEHIKIYIETNGEMCTRSQGR